MGSVGNNNSTNSKYTQTLKSVEDRIYDDPVETLVVIDSNGEVLVDKSEGLKDRVRITDEESAKMKDTIVTHNHPSSHTFSWQDINTLINRDLKEIRAVGADGSIVILTRIDSPTVEQSRTKRWFSDDFKSESDWYARQNLDPVWNEANSKGLSDAELQKVADRLNKQVDEFERRWLIQNAERYGYIYKEGKRGK